MNQALALVPIISAIVYSFCGTWGVVCLLTGMMFGFVEQTPIGMLVRSVGYTKIAKMVGSAISHSLKMRLYRFRQYLVGNVKTRGEYYDVSYSINNHVYKYPIKRKVRLSSPCPIFMILDPEGSDITDRVFEYLGPNKDCYITPDMIGLEKVCVHYNDATEKEIVGGERIM